jgi:hypothetical protein
MEPRGSCMLSKYSTTEPHLQPGQLQSDKMRMIGMDGDDGYVAL